MVKESHIGWVGGASFARLSDRQMFTDGRNFRFPGSLFGPQSVSVDETPGGR